MPNSTLVGLGRLCQNFCRFFFSFILLYSSYYSTHFSFQCTYLSQICQPRDTFSCICTLVSRRRPFTKRKGLEQRRYLSCSVGMQLTYTSLHFLTHTLRFAVTCYLANHCTWAARSACEDGFGSRLHITVIVWLQNLHIHVPQDMGFLGKRRARVTAPYQTIPLL